MLQSPETVKPHVPPEAQHKAQSPTALNQHIQHYGRVIAPAQIRKAAQLDSCSGVPKPSLLAAWGQSYSLSSCTSFACLEPPQGSRCSDWRCILTLGWPQENAVCVNTLSIKGRIGDCCRTIVTIKALRNVLQHSFGLEWKFYILLSQEGLRGCTSFLLWSGAPQHSIASLSCSVCRICLMYQNMAWFGFFNGKEIGISISSRVSSIIVWVAQPKSESWMFTLCVSLFLENGPLEFTSSGDCCRERYHEVQNKVLFMVKRAILLVFSNFLYLWGWLDHISYLII